MSSEWINLVYLVAAGLFILALKGLARPATAVRGNALAACGMLLAVVVTLLDRQIASFGVILAGLVAGSGLGAILAVRIAMTAMPQLVALFNGFGGGASVLVAGAALVETAGSGQAVGLDVIIATVASGLVGAVTFSGSLVAFGKLQELIPGRSVLLPGQKTLAGGLALVALALGHTVWLAPGSPVAYGTLVAVALILGVVTVLPVGGADMPVVIALLNAYSGLAASATGFVLDNSLLIIAGALVGASGLILTQIMCRAMNRSLAAVLFGGAVGGAKAAEEDVYGGKVKSASAEEVAMLLKGARRVVIVPGYGLAVAQAQHAVAELSERLGELGAEVDFAIHPVAGRMPGHMNVLLAEANVPYERLREMDDVNPLFAETDVAIVIGANDVVNPLARTDPTSPIAGMPILDVDKARTVVVIKRSLSPGFAGVANPLFAGPNTLMLFGDGKAAVLELIGALKAA